MQGVSAVDVFGRSVSDREPDSGVRRWDVGRMNATPRWSVTMDASRTRSMQHRHEIRSTPVDAESGGLRAARLLSTILAGLLAAGSAVGLFVDDSPLACPCWTADVAGRIKA